MEAYPKDCGEEGSGGGSLLYIIVECFIGLNFFKKKFLKFMNGVVIILTRICMIIKKCF